MLFRQHFFYLQLLVADILTRIGSVLFVFLLKYSRKGDWMLVGEKLKKLRKARGLSQEALANDLNVSRQSISKWELGNHYLIQII